MKNPKRNGQNSKKYSQMKRIFHMSSPELKPTLASEYNPNRFATFWCAPPYPGRLILVPSSLSYKKMQIMFYLVLLSLKLFIEGQDQE